MSKDKKRKKIIRTLPSLKQMVVMREILGPPKAALPIRPHEGWN